MQSLQSLVCLSLCGKVDELTHSKKWEGGVATLWCVSNAYSVAWLLINRPTFTVEAWLLFLQSTEGFVRNRVIDCLISWKILCVEHSSIDWLIDWIDSSPQRRAGRWLFFSCKCSCVSSTSNFGLLWFPVKKQFNKFILPEQGWSEGGMLARNCINGAASSWRGICLPGSSAVRAELCLSPTLAHRAPERWSSSSKFSGTHPRSPHLRKAKMLKATEPFYIPDLQTTADKCRSVKPPDFIPVSGF